LRRKDRTGPDGMRLFALGKRIGPRRTRRLFVRFCREASRLSDRFEIEIAPFEATLREPGSGFCIVVSPLRDLFLVSIGESRSFDVRVSSDESFVSALDLTLDRYLAAASKAEGAA
jgi:hypothetical protein